MEKLEDVLSRKYLQITTELLPGIEKFLRTTLAKESLSKLAETQRLYYVERLDVIQLPPHLPPKPDGAERTQMQGRKLPEPGKNKSDEDFIAHQRAISRQALSKEERQITSEHNPVPNDGLGIDSDQYDEGLYEEPVPMGSNFTDAHRNFTDAHRNFTDARNYLPAGSAATFEIDSDGDSSTSYESYDEPDIEEAYNNIGCDGQLKTDIPLPRLKTKRKKKSTSMLDRYYKQLHSTVHEGELHHRTKSSWTKRFCVLCDGIFYCYKDKDCKPIVGIPLLGYDVILQDKEKGRTNVLRLSHPGCETHFVSTDSASETQAWLDKIEPLCYTASAETTDDKSNDRTGSVSSMETYMENPAGSILNGSPSLKNRKVANTMSIDSKREKKGKLGKFLSETFGKKKGRAVAHHLEISEGSLLDRASLSSPDTIITGIVKLSSPSLLNESAWQYKHCAIRNGIFECFKDDSTSSDLDFSLLLTDYELSAPDKNSLSLAVTRQGETAFVIEPVDKLDQGDWLSALLKHVANGGVHSAPDCHEPNEDYTYVDNRDLLRGPAASLEDNSTCYSHNDGRSSEDERQYADLSDKEADEESSTGGGDVYDEPPLETGDRLSKVYEEVSDTSARLNTASESNKPSTEADSTEANSIDIDIDIDIDAETSRESTNVPMTKPVSEPSITALAKEPVEKGRQTRGDTQTKADVVSSPTPSTEFNRPSFSRESSCSSEGSSRKLGTIAKNRAMFENNCNQTTNGGTKWAGYKLAGTASPVVRRTPSLSSTASTKSTPNSAASSPKTSRASSGTVDRFKAAFESNNNIITDEQLSASPNTQHLSVCLSQSDSTKTSTNDTSNSSTKNRISPIKISSDKGEDTKPPPKFTAVFSAQTTVQVNSTKPRKLEIKSVTPTPYTPPYANSDSRAAEYNLGIDPTLRFDIDLSSKDKCVTLNSDGRTQSNLANNTPRKSSTLPTSSITRTTLTNTSLSATCPRTIDKSLPTVSSPNTSRANAKNFLSSTLQKLTAEDSRLSPSHSANSAAIHRSTPEQEQKRLYQLMQKLTSLRKERQKVRDQKLSTVLPEDLLKLNSEYKRIDAEYKATNQEISVLEDRKLQRIKDPNKDSIERRKSDAEKNSMIGKKKLWETSS